MTRRDFVGASAATFTLLTQASEAAVSGSARSVFSLNQNWLFGGRNVAGSTARDFDDGKFARVTLPHSNVSLPWHSFNEGDYQFVSVYRRHLRIPATFKSHRIFVDFEGAMTAATVSLNGQKLGEYRGGYTPFSFEITKHIDWPADNVLTVELDSTERADIPPFGGNIDYLTFGGIYREVWLRCVPQTFISNVFAKPVDPLTANRSVAVRCYLTHAEINRGGSLTAKLQDGSRTLKTTTVEYKGQPEYVELPLTELGEIGLWSLKTPKLYDITCTHAGDEYKTRIGFREAVFTPAGFHLNGEHIKLRGLNRHQTFPYVGAAMPARAQRRDAQILKNELKLNLVRTSHYPQSRHFLDACDELGLLVLEEIPGWQHIGDEAWQAIAVRNVGEMVRRDWNILRLFSGAFALTNRGTITTSTPRPTKWRMNLIRRGRPVAYGMGMTWICWKMSSR